MAESELEDIETVWTSVKDELLKNEFVVTEWRSFLRKLGLPPVELVNIDHKYYKESLSFKIDVCLDRWRQQQGLSMDSWYQPLQRCLIKYKMKMLSEKLEKVVFEYANQDDYCKDNGKDVVEDASSSNIKLSIHYVRFTNFATSLLERGIQRVYVDFHPFFGLPRDVTETRASTGAILPNEELQLDFELELPLNGDRGTDKLLAALVEPKEDEDRILFTVISDPNVQDVECEDIGIASLHLSDIIESKQDINKTNLTVYHIEDRTRKIGVLNVSLELLSVANDLLLTTSSLRDMQL